ncbi:DSD1 family PLP-dependent enzyme [Candidatus Poribacteria bacterium]|nr:DSD1 family PLP-dependent enzyme [Candidatus Poribacteria bacterium]
MSDTQSFIGKHRDLLDTPALLIDLDILDDNIQNMADYFSGISTDLRPHLKTHKNPIIAQKQIDAGAIGITCAKLGEAEAVVDFGIQDVLIANQIVGPQKIERLINLADRSRIMVAVDCSENVQDISDAAKSKGVTVRILIEVNIGMNRCGVEPGNDVLELAKHICDSPNLVFEGLMGYEGHIVARTSKDDREKAVKNDMQHLVDSKKLLTENGISVNIMSGGGTGTYDITSRIPEMTEIQAGSYVFMDSTYNRVEGLDKKFENSLSLLTTIVSRPQPKRIIVDAGMKVLTTEFGNPQPIGYSDLEMVGLSEEHGKLEASNDSINLKPGEKIKLLPTHCCTTVNLHDKCYGIRNEIVEYCWDITARGKAQ